jgi:hypothetical protein
MPPRKKTVNWFPHSCNHGKTIFILEQKYGIAGYAFWFKLLELLGSSTDHFFDFNNPANKVYLLAYTHCENAEEVLDLLASLEAIDPEAWESKIIWSDNFIKGIATTYINRRVEPPTRPTDYIKNYSTDQDPTCSLQENFLEGKELEEVQEGKELKEEKDKAPTPPNGSGGALAIPVEFAYKCPHFDIEMDYFKHLVEDYPGLEPPKILAEIKKAADYCSDNPKKHKRDAWGKIKNKRLYLRNWIERATVQGERGRPLSKAEQVTRANLAALKEVLGE